MSPIAVQPGKVEITEKRTRVVDESKSLDPLRALDLWEFIERIPESEWPQWELVLYRGHKSDYAGGSYIEIFRRPLNIEEVRTKYGGGPYHLMCKKSRTIQRNEDFTIEGAPINTNEITGDGRTGTMQPLLVAINGLIEELRAARGGNAAETAVKNAIELNKTVFTQGVETVKNAVAQPGPASPTDTLVKQILDAALAQLLNPSNPIKTFSEMATAMSNLGLFGKNQGQPNLAVEAIRQLPQLGESMVKAAEYWSAGKKAETETARIMTASRGGVPGPTPMVNVTPGNPVPANPASAVAPAATNAAAASSQAVPATAAAKSGQDLYIEHIERKIVEILMRTDLSCEEAAHTVLMYLDVEWPQLVDQLVGLGKDGILQVFASRPVLAAIPQNPRLSEFAEKFIELAKKVPVAPEAPPETKPN